ncbi:hypothetical protein [Pantoea sp. JKS000250]|uniref:hypothetical protein n=1 Tax=Pantoea sp. JKS000250 TaxID=1938795 RepID=UPI000D76C236|nr:hypothetical protein [Pantoea sp. JKS000250]MCJ7926496.1 hypothetical protein [Pantoea vagans]PXW19041.1 hypothetical protein BY447_0608 [Pantoea sp. JKS000250]
MSFDCLVFKEGQTPFIEQVKSDIGSFEIEDKSRSVYEVFSITRIEEIEQSTGKLALFIVANKARVSREKIAEEIKLRKPRPVKYF